MPTPISTPWRRRCKTCRSAWEEGSYIVRAVRLRFASEAAVRDSISIPSTATFGFIPRKDNEAIFYSVIHRVERVRAGYDGPCHGSVQRSVAPQVAQVLADRRRHHGARLRR